MATELTQAWWKKNKAKTLKSTGLGETIGQYEQAMAELKGLATSELTAAAFAKFKAAENLVAAVLPAAVEKATKACNATLHKDTLAVLKEYKSKLVPAAGAKLSDLQGIYEKKYKALEDQIKTSCTTLHEAAGHVLDASQTAADQCQQLLTVIDGEKMAIIEDLSEGPTGQAKALQRVKTIQSKVAEIGHKKTAAAQAVTAGRNTTRAQWIYKPNVLREDNFKRMGDKITGLHDAAEMAVNSIDNMVKEAGEAVAEANKLIKGGADLSKVYLDSAKRAEKKAADAAGRLGGAMRETGGRVDQLKFDFINAQDKFKVDADRTHLLSEIKRVAGGIAATDKQCQNIGAAALQAQAEIDKSLKTFPKFVLEDEASFGSHFKAIRAANQALEDHEEDAKKGRATLKDLTAKLAKAASNAAAH